MQTFRRYYFLILQRYRLNLCKNKKDILECFTNKAASDKLMLQRIHNLRYMYFV